MTKILTITLICAVFVLSGCSDEQAYILGPQTLDDVEILVEIRPGAPTPGMNEFIVVATHKDHIPAKEFVVSIKIKGSGEWRQSIQDGHSGVYRRAIRVNRPQTDILLVQMDKTGEKSVLEFPLITKGASD